jgi:carbamoyl-phosphate synthase large subunit
LPYTSKTRGVNLIDVSTDIMLGKKLREIGINEIPEINYVGVKVPQFSFMRLSGADPILGVEMMSTGEAACLGDNLADALLKALQSVEFKIPKKGDNVFITIGSKKMKKKMIPLVKEMLDMGFIIFATENTANFLKKSGLKSIKVLYKVDQSERKPNVLDYLLKNKINLVINIPVENGENTYEDEYIIRRLAVEFNVPVVTTYELAFALVKVLKNRKASSIITRSLNEYMDSLPFTHW